METWKTYDHIGSLAFSPDGSLLAGAGHDFSSVVTLWSLPGGEERSIPPNPNYDYQRLKGFCVAFSNEGVLAIGTSIERSDGIIDPLLGGAGRVEVGVVRLVQPPYNQRGDICEVGNDIASVAFSPDGNWLAGGVARYGKGTALCLRGPGHEPLFRLGTPAKAIAFSPDSSALVTAAGEDLMLWQMPGEELLEEFKRVKKEKYDPPTIDLYGKLEHYCKGKHHAALKLGREKLPSASSVAFHPHDGTLLASGHSDGIVRLWRLPSGQQGATLERGLEVEGHQNEITSIAISSDGQLLVSGSNDKTLRIWRLPGGEPLSVLTGHEHEITSVAISPGDKLLASASWHEKAVRLWKLRTIR